MQNTRVNRNITTFYVALKLIIGILKSVYEGIQAIIPTPEHIQAIKSEIINRILFLNQKVETINLWDLEFNIATDAQFQYVLSAYTSIMICYAQFEIVNSGILAHDQVYPRVAFFLDILAKLPTIYLTWISKYR